jgi:electron transfer flavoprotein alpha subunit
VDVCPVNAIRIEEIKEKETELTDYKGVLIFAEQRKSVVHPVAYELLGIGKNLADIKNELLSAVILGHNIEKSATELLSRGADKVFYYDDPLLEDFRDDPYTELLANICNEIKPSIFLIGATSIGRSMGPKLAARLKTGLTADCTQLNIDEETGLLFQTRPAYGGNIMATIITPQSRPQMATVRYKMMKEASKKQDPKGELIKKDFDASSLPDRVNILGFEKAKGQVKIVDADIIVSGGRGLGEQKGFEVIQKLAKVLGGAVGASRPTVDEGWIDYHHQVGLSGRTVRPQVYIACGISGSAQHQAGMKTSDVIIALNKDPEAPIFRISTLGAIGDLYEVIPRIIDKIKEKRKSA